MTIKISELLSDVKECALPLKEPSSSSWGKIQKLTFDKINGAQAAPAPRRRRCRRIAILAAAALLSVCVTVTAAASGALSSVGDLFAAWFGGQPDQIELIEQLGQPLGQTDSRNGITISADAILSDGDNFVVLFTVSRDNGEPLIPADVQPGGHLYFGCSGITDTEESIHFARNKSGFVNGAPGDLSAQFLCYYRATNGLPSTFQPDFNSLEYWLDGGTQVIELYERAIDPNDPNIDVWRFELPLPTGGQIVETMPIDNEPFSANGEEFAVTGLKVSPLAVTVDYEVTSTTPTAHAIGIEWDVDPDGNRQPAPDYGADNGPLTENMTLLLRKKDGTEIDLSTYVDDLGYTCSPGTVTTDWEQDKYLCRYGGVLPEVIPMEDMECVIFNGLEYPVG